MALDAMSAFLIGLIVGALMTLGVVFVLALAAANGEDRAQ